eukprot:jgi/Botrbrau1/8301/Bobra.0251s0027.2
MSGPGGPPKPAAQPGKKGRQVLSPLITEKKEVVAVPPGSFMPAAHFYPRVLNAHIHPLVKTFLSLGNDRIAKRYCHLHPEADPAAVSASLQRTQKHFRWAGADVFITTTERGHRRSVVIETNSCPSGQKSMPPLNEADEQAGYRRLLQDAFMPTLLSAQDLPEGILAVLYDKNKMEASGYAAVLADLTGETIMLVPFYDNETNPVARFTDDGVLEVRIDGAAACHEALAEPEIDDDDDEEVDGNSTDGAESLASLKDGVIVEPVWRTCRAAIRYVTQKPWKRVPPITRTLIFNPVLACLSGGRNKMLAAKAYDLHNAELKGTGLAINTPETMWNVRKAEVPLWVGRMGGIAVVKVPYANAGQGVWTIVNQQELDAFMAIDHHYDSFIVQALIGNSGWSSQSSTGPQLYHVGTVPNAKGNIHAFDLRIMCGSSPTNGFFPVAIYARRARRALPEQLVAGKSSWDILGTNLSVKLEDGSWTSQTERLLIMDSRDFNLVGIGLDDLIEAYMQTVMAMTAIDSLADKLVTSHGNFRHKLFTSLNPDPALLDELYILPNVTVPTLDESVKGEEEQLERQLHLAANCVPGPQLKPGEVVIGDSPKHPSGQASLDGGPVLISASATAAGDEE